VPSVFLKVRYKKLDIKKCHSIFEWKMSHFSHQRSLAIEITTFYLCSLQARAGDIVLRHSGHQRFTTVYHEGWTIKTYFLLAALTRLVPVALAGFDVVDCEVELTTASDGCNVARSVIEDCNEQWAGPEAASVVDNWFCVDVGWTAIQTFNSICKFYIWQLLTNMHIILTDIFPDKI